MVGLRMHNGRRERGETFVPQWLQVRTLKQAVRCGGYSDHRKIASGVALVDILQRSAAYCEFMSTNARLRAKGRFERMDNGGSLSFQTVLKKYSRRRLYDRNFLTSVVYVSCALKRCSRGVDSLCNHRTYSFCSL